MDRYELRRQDYSLSDDQTELQAVYAKFFRTRCPLEVVHAAEQTGFDKDLWEQLCVTGATSMALPESAGGDGATLVDLTLVAEELGRVIAPVPWIDHVCTARLLDRLGPPAWAELGDEVLSGRQVLALDPRVDAGGGVRLIASGAVADHIIVRDGDEIVRLSFDTRPGTVTNIGRLPAAWVDPAAADHRAVLATGPAALAAYDRALDEWRLLTAAALVGLVDESLRIAAEFATTRYTMGVPISTLQGISHPLANIAITVHAARNLTRRAAWFLEFEPDYQPGLPAAAFVYIAEEAPRAATMAVQVQGGLGVATESAASAYLVRAKGWPLAAGDLAASAVQVAEHFATTSA
ncbi:acyl-CoA dehydrogenase [Nocardia cyriacigeorgica]|uniref:Acyl-CoA dehydrogenase n=1 Tax=Nocardia cyriacigeorgica TaxID=135487 RepID=A0A5R8P7W7_9NOCA|nr:acyl-CoA dehydrogenase [Nocardia cyriacigeorgica]TLF98277.1 acyl-CoA dehydrogenase [Nocardia cyriacigeorgica]